MTRRRPVLIDTSAWVEYLRDGGDPVTQQAVRAALDGGHAVLCDLVLLELWNGARGERQPRFLRVLEATLDWLPTTDAVWSRTRELARRSRAGGLTVPATDLLIAALARTHGTDLMHRDTHYDQLASLDSGATE